MFHLRRGCAKVGCCGHFLLSGGFFGSAKFATGPSGALSARCFSPKNPVLLWARFGVLKTKNVNIGPDRADQV
ncbi:MAG TPA: hypothetical protein PK858_09405, partial [Saprospiraceae bacterium]|nr:hypothetical protein [Saprospiraceae bacterium]